jgi:arsenite oxidase small subunit
MSRCDKLVDVGRRQFLRGSAFAAAGAAASVTMPGQAKAQTALARVDYPSNRLANIADLTVNEPLDIAYPDDDSPGVLLKLGKAVEGGVGPDGDIVGFSTICPHKGFPLIYNAEDRTLNCPGHYSRFDSRPAASRSGARRPRTCRNTRCASTRRATSTPKASTSCSTAACPTCSEGGRNGLQASDRPPCRSSRPTPSAQRDLPLLHRRLRLQRLYLAGEQAGRHGPGDNVFGVDLSEQQFAETDAWYAPSMYNIVKQDGKDVHIVIKPDHECVVNSGLGSIRGARMAEMSYSRGPPDPAAAPDRPAGLALRPDAADELGRRARPRRAGHRRGHRGSGRGRADRLGLRPRRRRRRLREHLGHRQALFRRDEGEEHPHPQSPGLQLRGPRHPRHGRRRAQQLLRGRRARRHDRCVGANPLETQTNYFLNHWVPNLRGTTLDKKQEGDARRAARPPASSSSTRAAR